MSIFTSPLETFRSIVSYSVLVSLVTTSCAESGWSAPSLKTSICSTSFRFCASLTQESSLPFALSLLWSLFLFSISQ